ncbi:GNAT family N-acetyltransferase [Shinella curvata]|uniref:GNAT family N-acetyltransferase n=1 Tax=Shinella curvata TaxID=1817964 RepID=A0ABT8X7K2_9HYPH|nr:GNAT family N-acetyltransferase [Shinella curvata]MCJ8052401.1 GNAT family N-acetyltransferase [Shinella curvata]MDO6119650.1 GNAT family N-acetyltransferase [Shinella curvata]
MQIKVIHGEAVTPYIADLAQLRTTVFRAFPYLYEGSEDYEASYLATYAQSPESLFVLALDGETIVGASTGVPMTDASDVFKVPFVAAGIDPEKVFYFGESVLLSTYRGRGLGVRFFEEREAYARRLGRFDWCAFCAVERPSDHPLRPADYAPLDEFWGKRGYAHRADLRTMLAWQDIGETDETEKPMSFWLKPVL